MLLSTTDQKGRAVGHWSQRDAEVGEVKAAGVHHSQEGKDAASNSYIILHAVKCFILLPFSHSLLHSPSYTPPLPSPPLPSRPLSSPSPPLPSSLLPSLPLPVPHFQYIYVLLEERVLRRGALPVVCVGQDHLK